PYNEDENRLRQWGDYRVVMAAARQAVSELHGSACSQADLAARLSAMANEETPDRPSSWLEGGWRREPMPAPEGDASITIIREEDLPLIKDRLGAENSKTWISKRLVPWTIPMLYNRGFTYERRIGGYPLAPLGSVRYCEKEGATWQLK